MLVSVDRQMYSSAAMLLSDYIRAVDFPSRMFALGNTWYSAAAKVVVSTSVVLFGWMADMTGLNLFRNYNAFGYTQSNQHNIVQHLGFPLPASSALAS